MQNRTKLRILYLYQHLVQHTDAKHTLSTAELMYDTDEPVSVQLYCPVSVMKYLIDQFGSDFETVVVDDEHFKATVRVCTSTTFYSWGFGFNGKIKIVSPKQVTTAYEEMLQHTLDV